MQIRSTKLWAVFFERTEGPMQKFKQLEQKNKQPKIQQKTVVLLAFQLVVSPSLTEQCCWFFTSPYNLHLV